MSKGISQRDHSCDDEKICRNRAYPPPHPEISHHPKIEIIAIVQLDERRADQVAAEDKGKVHLVQQRDEHKPIGKVIRYKVKGMRLQYDQYTYRPHDIQTEYPPAGIKVDPEYVYDALQIVI